MGNMETGKLYVCATPIGNLGDITVRVLETLRRVALIAAEDTRHTRKLLNHYEIVTPLTSYHEHNEQSKTPELLSKLGQGWDIALVSDAGTPGISDPGGVLIRACRDRKIPVDVLPGANAALTALVLSGIDSRTFYFAGFLPSTGAKRKRALAELAAVPGTLILYEAPHRLLATLKDVRAVLGDRQGAVGRELTKMHQELRTGSLSELEASFLETAPRGECSLVIAADGPVPKPEEADSSPEAWRTAWESLMAGGTKDKQALKEVACQFGVSRRALYQALKVKERPFPDSENINEKGI